MQPQVSPSVAPEAPQIVPQQDLAPQQTEQLAGNMQAAGTGFLRAADYLQDARDDAITQDAYNHYAEGARKIVQQHRALEGKNAMDATPAMHEALDNLRQSFDGRFENGKQAEMFKRKADVREADTREALDGWDIAQTKAYNIGALDAGMKGSTVDYLSTWQDPAKAATYSADVKAKANKLSDIHGDSDEERRLRLLAATTAMHTGVIEQTLDTDYKTATSYYEQHKDEISPGTQAHLEDQLRNATIAQKSRDFAARAEDFATKKGGTLLQQQDYALAVAKDSYKNKLLTPEEYEASERRIKQNYAFDRSEEAQRVVETYNGAEKFLTDNPSMGIDALDSKTKTVLQANGKWDQIGSFAKNRVPLNDPVFYAGMREKDVLWHKAVTDEEFEAMLAGNVSQVHAQTLRDKRNALLGKTLPGQTTEENRKAYKKNAARQLEIIPADPEEKPTRTMLDNEQQFDTQMNEAVQREEAAKTRKLTDAEYKKFVDNYVLEQKQTVQTYGSDSGFKNLLNLYGFPGVGGPYDRKLSTLTEEEKLRAFVTVGGRQVKLTDIPPWFQTKTANELRAEGIAATFSQVADMWLAQGRPTTPPKVR